MLLAAGFVPSLLSLSALKSRALRKGVWYKISPAARALIDAALLYLRRGGRIKSPALLEALRKAAEEVLRLAAPIRVSAKAVGYAVARRLGVEIDEEVSPASEEANPPVARHGAAQRPRAADATPPKSLETLAEALTNAGEKAREAIQQKGYLDWHTYVEALQQEFEQELRRLT